MKLLLLVSLPLLAWTNVIIAKSTLNEIARGQNTSVSSLPTIRNLKEDTTSGTSHQAGYAEERSGVSVSFGKIATKLAQKGTKLEQAYNRKFKTPEKLFEKMDFTNAGVFESPAFKDWALAVQKKHGESAGDEILEKLLPKFRGFDKEVKLAKMLVEAERKASIWSITRPTCKSLYAYWKTDPENHPDTMLTKLGLDENFAINDDTLRGIWFVYAVEYGMKSDYINKKLSPLWEAYEKLVPPQPPSSVEMMVPKVYPKTSK